MYSRRDRRILQPIGGIFLVIAGLLSSQLSQALADASVGDPERNVIPKHYNLSLNIDPDIDTFSGEVSIDVQIAKATKTIWLHGNKLNVRKAEIRAGDGQALIVANYKQMDDSGVARLTLPTSVPAGAATLTLTYSANLSKTNEGMHLLEQSGQRYVATHFETSAARLAFPGFDEPAYKVPFDITVTTQKEHVVVTNTPLVEETELAGGKKRLRFATTRPLPTYLIAVAVGPYDIIDWGLLRAKNVNRPPISIRGVAAMGRGEELRYSLDNKVKILLGLEEYFGIAYPYQKLDSIAAPNFGLGGMENAGAIMYTDNLLLLDENAPLDRKSTNIEIQAHEIAHQWFGNMVTPKSWSDMWLKESFTQWMTFHIAHKLWSEQYNGRQVIRAGIDAMNIDSTLATRAIRQPAESGDGVRGWLTLVVYNKGAAVLSMFESYMGADKFRDGVRLFLNRHAHGVATEQDFRRALSDAAGNSFITSSLDSFLALPGVPLVTAEYSCYRRRKPQVRLHQTRYRPPGSKISEGGGKWQIPVCLSLLSEEGTDRQCVMLKEEEQSFSVGEKGDCPTALMPNANGAGYYRWALTHEGWKNLGASLNDLNGGELLSLMDSLMTGFSEGDVDATLFFKVVRLMAYQDDWDIAASPIASLTLMLNSFVSDQDLPLFRTKLNEIYGPRLLALEKEEATNNTILLRDELYEFLAYETRLPALRQRLAEFGRAYIGDLDDGVVHWNAVPPDLLEISLAIAAQEGDEKFFDALISHFSAMPPGPRRPILAALSRVTHPDWSNRVRDLALTSAMLDNEAFGYMFMQSEESRNRLGFWNWLRKGENLNAMLGRMPPFIRGLFPRMIAGRFCSLKLRDDVEDLLGEPFRKIPGGVSELDATLEEIELCTAQEATLAPKLAQYMVENKK